MTLRESAIRGVFWSAIQNWGGNLIATGVLLVLANLLEVEAFGLVAYAAVFVGFLKIFQRQGFGQALIQRAEIDSGHLYTAFWANIISGALLMAGIFAAAENLASLVGKPSLASILQALSITLFVDSLGSTPNAILRRRLAFRSLALRSLTSSTAGGIVGIAMALYGFGIWSLVGQRLVSSLVGTLTLLTACRWIPRFEGSLRHFRDLFGFGVFSMGNETVAFFEHRTADLIVGTVLGDRALGYYALGYRLLEIMTQLFTTTFSSVALPTFSRLQHNAAKMREALLAATGMTTLAAFPAFLGAAVLAPEMVMGLLGTQWAASIPILQILAFIGILQSVTFFNTPVIVACGKPSWAFALSFANAAAGVAVILLAVGWGVAAVAAACVLRGYLFAPLQLWFVRRQLALDIRAYLRQYVTPGVSAILMVVAVWAFKGLFSAGSNLYFQLVTSVLLGCCVYISSVYVMSPGRLRTVLEYLRISVTGA